MSANQRCLDRLGKHIRLIADFRNKHFGNKSVQRVYTSRFNDLNYVSEVLSAGVDLPMLNSMISSASSEDSAAKKRSHQLLKFAKYLMYVER